MSQRDYCDADLVQEDCVHKVLLTVAPYSSQCFHGSWKAFLKSSGKRLLFQLLQCQSKWIILITGENPQRRNNEFKKKFDSQLGMKSKTIIICIRKK